MSRKTCELPVSHSIRRSHLPLQQKKQVFTIKCVFYSLYIAFIGFFVWVFWGVFFLENTIYCCCLQKGKQVLDQQWWLWFFSLPIKTQHEDINQWTFNLQSETFKGKVFRCHSTSIFSFLLQLYTNLFLYFGGSDNSLNNLCSKHVRKTKKSPENYIQIWSTENKPETP